MYVFETDNDNTFTSGVCCKYVCSMQEIFQTSSWCIVRKQNQSLRSWSQLLWCELCVTVKLIQDEVLPVLILEGQFTPLSGSTYALR